MNENANTERWTDVKGYEGIYQVSDLGRVRSVDRKSSDGRAIKGTTLKPVRNSLGYLRVNLCRDGVARLTQVHRIVAEAFLENPDGLPEVNHKDENPANNSACNLEWCSHEYNMRYGTAIARRREKVAGQFVNREDLSKAVEQYDDAGNIIRRFPSIMEASRQTGAKFGLIAMCCRGERNKTCGYKWKFAK